MRRLLQYWRELGDFTCPSDVKWMGGGGFGDQGLLGLARVEVQWLDPSVLLLGTVLL